MIANLGMYDMPAVQPANNRFWAAIRAALGYGPAELNRDRDLWDIWQSPELLLSQTCGLPYRSRLHDQVTMIATPDYGLEGCPPGYYRSFIVARADHPGQREQDFDGATLASNEAVSQSGWAGPMAHLAGLGVTPGAVIFTGAHVASVKAVAEGAADFAGIDAVTWALLQRHDPLTATLKVIGQTAPTPGLPFITASTRDPAPLARAIDTALAGLAPDDRAALHLKGLVRIPAAAYLAVPPAPVPPLATAAAAS